jgi:DNA repair exonuclease SbcCD ATPase subunit
MLHNCLNSAHAQFWLMGYRQQARSSKHGRGRQRSRREKKKTRGKKHSSSGKYLLEENQAPTSEEVAEKTLSGLHSLGNQTFAVFPFVAYFDDWIVSLKGVLATFESNPSVITDEQFVKERTQLLANVEQQLEERRRKEVSLSEAISSLSKNKTLLERIKKEYATSSREIEARKNREIKRLNRNIAVFKGELDDLAKVKAGLFRAMSKKAKAQKEAEITQRLNDAQSALESAAPNSAAEKERLRNDYEKQKQLVSAQIEKLQKEITDADVDGSSADRQAACEALANAVNALLKRK